MTRELRTSATILATAASLALGACGGHSRAVDTATAGGEVGNAPVATSPTTTTTAPDTVATTNHHSKLAGAAIGAVAGHYLGGHAVAGAAAGALIQHERNKHHH